MQFHWEAMDSYEEIGGREAVEAAARAALGQVPREHLRQLESVVALDRDPKGKSLGIYNRDHAGIRIELYVTPHVRDILPLPAAIRLWALRLHLAHTLFHEVGHHLTLTLNRRRPPSRRRPEVSQTLEKWAEEYVRKRMEKFCQAQLAPGGPAEDERAAFEQALRCLQGFGF